MAPISTARATSSPRSIGATKVFAGDKRYNDFRQQQARIGYEFEHKFNEVFTLRQRARYSQLGNNQQYVYSEARPDPREHRGLLGRYLARKPRSEPARSITRC